MSDTTPTMVSVLRGLVATEIGQMRKSMPGVVVSYDPVSMRASVQPAIQNGFELRGERTVERFPIINEVPILWPAWGGVRFRGTLQPGDEVWVMFSDLSLDRWKALGADRDPEDDRRHHISDAVAYPGGMPDASDAEVMIEMTPTELRLGGTAASESVIRGDTFLDGAVPSFGLLELLSVIAASLSSLGEVDASTLMSNPAWAATLAAARSPKVKVE